MEPEYLEKALSREPQGVGLAQLHPEGLVVRDNCRHCNMYQHTSIYTMEDYTLY